MIKMPNTYNTDNDKVVGFKKEAETIIDQLIHGSKEREDVLITGMSGLGKTTLARRVYDEKSVDEHFDKRAWCTISQEYDCKHLLNKIYNQVCGSETTMDNVADILRKSLMGWRYLIVLDDIWSLKAWEDLNRSFPSCDHGSRIILTSRQENVVSEAKHIFRLPFFTIDESWELLQVKLFKGKRCPEELENIGRAISKNCGGLPLVIGLVAGLLESVEKCEWQKVLNTLNSHNAVRDGIHSNDAIELSYKYLPHHLKPCLLYFAAFREDNKIDVSHLIKLWISEGFVDIIEKETVEDEAEDYLNHLVNSNLIIVSKRKYDGHILKSIVNDLVHDFCLVKAKEENFLSTIIIKNKLDPLEFSPRRISLHNYTFCAPIELVPRDSSIHTVLGFNHSPFALDIHNVSWVAKHFEHLIILDLEFICVDKSILLQVNSLIHLRLLALKLNGYGYVSSRSLENLEFLITLRLGSGPDLHLPKYFWNMRSLRHMSIFHVCDSCSEESTASVIETIPYSGVLQTLDLMLPLYTRDEHLLRKNPHLKNLTCWVTGSSFPEIGFLHHLESLRLYYNQSPTIHLLNDLKISKFPASIKEIYLYAITLSLSAISTISQLPNLEALILTFCNTEGLVQNVEEEIQFPRLKYLKIFDHPIFNKKKKKFHILNININADESFPCLEQLILENCECDKFELSCTLANISTLKVIDVKYCHPNVERSAKRIQEYASEMGNEQLNVNIGPSWMSQSNQRSRVRRFTRSWMRRFTCFCCLGGGANRQFSQEVELETL